MNGRKYFWGVYLCVMLSAESFGASTPGLMVGWYGSQGKGEMGTNSVRGRGPTGPCELVTQAGEGKLERVREILEAGADIDGVCEQTVRTALMAAVENKRYEVVDYLLASGADPNRKNEGGVGVVTSAAESCNVRSLKLLVRYGVDLSENSFENHYALWKTSFAQGHDRKACEEMVRLMFGLGMRHQKWPERRPGSTPIIMASQIGRSLEVVKLLLANGADVEQRSASGYNALHAGIMAENIKVLDFLIKAKLDLEAKSNFGNTPLILCSKFEHSTESVGRFVRAGASVHARNDKGETALMFAAQMSLGSVRALVEGGARVNEVDLEGNTALMKAAGVIGDEVEIVKYLVEHGADVEVKDRAALLRADLRGNKRVAAYLRKIVGQKKREKGGAK